MFTPRELEIILLMCAKVDPVEMWTVIAGIRAKVQAELLHEARRQRAQQVKE